MDSETSLISVIKNLVLYLLIVLAPVFFLPLTQEYFITGKLYFLLFGSLLLLTLSLFEFLITKKLVIKRISFDAGVVLLFITAVVSIIVSSPNKIQALLNSNFGIGSLFGLSVLYYYASRNTQHALKKNLLYISSLIVSVLAIVFIVNPFQHNTSLPPYLEFLKSQTFTPIGNQLDMGLFLGFVSMIALSEIFSKGTKRTTHNMISLVVLALSLIGIGVVIFSYFKTKEAFILTPFHLSWYGAVETFKQPLTALFGVGVDNYASMFTRIKDASYNNTNLWQISSFNASRSTVLHVVTEMGLFGAAAFVLLLLQVIKQGVGNTTRGMYHYLPAVYLVCVFLFFPPSIITLFLLFLLMGGIGLPKSHDESKITHIDTAKILPLYIVVLVLGFLGVGAMGYFSGRAYGAEIAFKQSLNALGENGNLKNVYDNMRKAILINPYIERYRTNFSQVNLLIANNVASKLNQEPDKKGKKPELTEAERQTIAQALQAAIEEAKATATLNPQKASNWENLAAIYRNIINVAQGADAWTVSAYQRAIVLDPQNPSYRLNLGGVMFSFKNYDEAIKLFEQAIAIKPDWANAYYNLGWAAYQKKDYQRAASAMQSTVSLLDPKKEETDYKKALQDLNEFKKMLPEDEQATEGATKEQGSLSIPTPPVADTLEPKIELPKEASPEAQ